MATATQSAVSQVTVNAAFLQEIKEVNEELWQLLQNIREVCSCASMVREHTAQLVDMLIDLRDQLALHFALEEAYGYLEHPNPAEMPTSDLAIQLRSEHRQLFRRASELAEQGEQLLFDGNLAEIVTTLPLRFADLDHELMRHESRETQMIQSQFYDLGAGD